MWQPTRNFQTRSSCDPIFCTRRESVIENCFAVKSYFSSAHQDAAFTWLSRDDKGWNNLGYIQNIMWPPRDHMCPPYGVINPILVMLYFINLKTQGCIHIWLTTSKLLAVANISTIPRWDFRIAYWEILEDRNRFVQRVQWNNMVFVNGWENLSNVFRRLDWSCRRIDYIYCSDKYLFPYRWSTLEK